MYRVHGAVQTGRRPLAIEVPAALPERVTHGEGIGVLVALIVLVMTFGSALAAGIPLLTATAGVAASVAAIFAATRFTDVTSTDYVPALLDKGRERADAERLPVQFQVADAERSTYEIQDYLTAIEQMAITTLRNIIGAMDLEQTLTSRDAINSALRTALDETTGSWGVRISRVELRSITPPANVQQAMEAQMRAEREKRAAILTAEGQQQSAIKVAEGEKQSAILKAEGERQAAILRAEGESQALANVVSAIHTAGVDDKVLAYQQIQQWRYIAAYPSNKLWLVPQELSQAAAAMSRAFGASEAGGSAAGGPAAG